MEKCKRDMSEKTFPFQADAFRGHGFNLLEELAVVATVAHRLRLPAGLSARAVPAGVAAFHYLSVTV